MGCLVSKREKQNREKLARPNYGLVATGPTQAPGGQYAAQSPVYVPEAEQAYRPPARKPKARPQDEASYDDDSVGAPDPILLSAQGPTQAIGTYEDHVLRDKNQSSFRIVKQLGRGGFGVVSLCERTGKAVQSEREIPARFALKELISPKVFPIGQNEDVRDYLPLNEAAIQRYLRHSAIVETYWADVRYLHPDTNQPLDIGINDVVSRETWMPLDNVTDMEKTFTAAVSRSGRAALPYKEVKLQMRIAMEHCDLASVKDYLVDNPERGGRNIVYSLRMKKKLNITMDTTRCTIITALDIAEALKFMHKSKTIHGDLKPHNILLVSDPSSETGFRAKISDFGLSQHMTKDQSQVLVSKGTEAYLSAEVFQNFALTEKSDVYALGLVMWELYYGIFWHAIYDKEKKRRRARTAREMGDYQPSCNEHCNPRFASTVHSCLLRDPSERPTATEVVTQLNWIIAEMPSDA